MVSKGSTPSFADGPDQALYLADPDGSRLRALTTPRYILSSEVWSPNGSTLLFVRSTTSNPHRSTIYRINADGSGEAPLAAMPAAFQFSPEWSPDGRRIVAYLDGTYILDPDGSIVDSLAGVGATWSPDGTRLAISADAGGHTGIHVIDADGTNETILSPFDDALENWPEWSPDGTKIAFFRRHPFSTLADTAYIMNADGTGRYPLAPSLRVSEIAWSPEGTRIAVVAYVSGGTQLYVLHTDGVIADVASEVGDVCCLSWRP